MDPFEFSVGEQDGNMVMANRWGETTPMPLERYSALRDECVRYAVTNGLKPRVPSNLEPITDNVPNDADEIAALVRYYKLGR